MSCVLPFIILNHIKNLKICASISGKVSCFFYSITEQFQFFIEIYSPVRGKYIPLCTPFLRGHSSYDLRNLGILSGGAKVFLTIFTVHNLYSVYFCSKVYGQSFLVCKGNVGTISVFEGKYLPLERWCPNLNT